MEREALQKMKPEYCSKIKNATSFEAFIKSIEFNRVITKKILTLIINCDYDYNYYCAKLPKIPYKKGFFTDEEIIDIYSDCIKELPIEIKNEKKQLAKELIECFKEDIKRYIMFKLKQKLKVKTLNFKEYFLAEICQDENIDSFTQVLGFENDALEKIRRRKEDMFKRADEIYAQRTSNPLSFHLSCAKDSYFVQWLSLFALMQQEVASGKDVDEGIFNEVVLVLNKDQFLLDKFVYFFCKNGISIYKMDFIRKEDQDAIKSLFSLFQYVPEISKKIIKDLKDKSKKYFTEKLKFSYSEKIYIEKIFFYLKEYKAFESKVKQLRPLKNCQHLFSNHWYIESKVDLFEDKEFPERLEKIYIDYAKCFEYLTSRINPNKLLSFSEETLFEEADATDTWRWLTDMIQKSYYLSMDNKDPSDMDHYINTVNNGYIWENDVYKKLNDFLRENNICTRELTVAKLIKLKYCCKKISTRFYKNNAALFFENCLLSKLLKSEPINIFENMDSNMKFFVELLKYCINDEKSDNAIKDEQKEFFIALSFLNACKKLTETNEILDFDIKQVKQTYKRRIRNRRDVLNRVFLLENIFSKYSKLKNFVTKDEENTIMQIKEEAAKDKKYFTNKEKSYKEVFLSLTGQSDKFYKKMSEMLKGDYYQPNYKSTFASALAKYDHQFIKKLEAFEQQPADLFLVFIKLHYLLNLYSPRKGINGKILSHLIIFSVKRYNQENMALASLGDRSLLQLLKNGKLMYLEMLSTEYINSL